MKIIRNNKELILNEVLKEDKTWFKVSKVLKSDDVIFNCKNCGIEVSKKVGSFLSNKKISLNELYCKKCKTEKTCLEKYGVKTISQSKEIKEKIKNSFLQKYGVENPMFLETSKQKIKETSLKKYGVESPNQFEEIKNKKEETFIEKYGVKTNLISIEQKEKTKQILKERFGEENFRQSELSKKLLKIKAYENHKKLLFDKFELITSIMEFEARGENKLQCKTCNTIFKYNTSHGFEVIHCPTCNETSIGGSFEEDSFYEFINSLTDKEIIRNTRLPLNNEYEIDVYIPELHLGFEYDGLFWHMEQQGKDKNYHLNKQNKAKENEIDLFFIRSDEWQNKQEIIKSIIKNKFGIYTKYYARKCEVRFIEHKEASPFIEQNHIQGSINASIYIGLFYNNELISVISFGKNRYKDDGYELYRFVNKINTTTIGGFSKMFNFFLKNINPDKVITFSDKRLFNKNTYGNAGFIQVEDSEPNYLYYKGDKYAGSRYQFQKHKLAEKLENFNPILTEYENMLANKYDRIWDCGNRKFVWIKK